MTNNSQNDNVSKKNDMDLEEEITPEVHSEDDQEAQNDQVADRDVSNLSDDSATVLNLPPGDALTPATALDITRARNTRLIILAGAVGCGKTTLIASIYEMFLDGPFAGYLFTGSKTLLDFERCCHDSRLSSKRVTPTTERTHRESDYRLLHLQVSKEELENSSQDLLFMDITGELFEEIRDSTEECKRHDIFVRADSFVLLIDGEKLCDPSERGQAVSDALLLLRRCLDANILGNHSFVYVLFAKWDLLKVAIQKDERMEAYIQKVQSKKFEDPFTDRVGRIRFERIAARPDVSIDSGLSRAYGLSSLFRSWVDESPESRTTRHSTFDNNLIEREIDRNYLTLLG